MPASEERLVAQARYWIDFLAGGGAFSPYFFESVFLCPTVLWDPVKILIIYPQMQIIAIANERDRSKVNQLVTINRLNLNDGRN